MGVVGDTESVVSVGAPLSETVVLPMGGGDTARSGAMVGKGLGIEKGALLARNSLDILAMWFKSRLSQAN
jgi:hypothetical protein